MRYLSVCSGVGTDHVAAPAHWTCAGFAEIDPFARAVLAHRFPEVPLYGDFTTLDTADVGAVDLVVGGTPCQSFSVAGKRLGIDDPRGNLTIEFVRLGIRLGAHWLFWENVPGVLSSNAGSDFGSFLEVLADGGYQCAWRVLDAQYFGVPQRRRRVYLVACRGAGADVGTVASVLFERDGSQWHPPARRSSGQDVAGTLGGGTGNRGWAPDTDRMTFVPESVGTITTAFGPKNYGNLQEVASGSLVAFTSKDAGGDAGEVAPTLRGGNHVDGNENGGVPPAVAFDAWDNRDSVPGDTADPVRASGRSAVASETVVRRLTPLECERLQGLPDGHTAVPFRGRAVAADGNRYRAIGNGWAVPVVRWLFARLDRVHVGCADVQRLDD